jgi:hypothetical protein
LPWLALVCGSGLHSLPRDQLTRDELMGKRLNGRGAATKHPLYGLWQNMLARCRNPNLSGWHRYGGRGITVCDEWRSSFWQFVDDMGERPSPKHSVERYDNDGPYAPWNCGWETVAVQANNRSTTRFVEINGESLPLIGVAAMSGLPRSTILQRIHRGWTGADLLLPLNGRPLPPRSTRGFSERRLGTPQKGRPDLTNWIRDLVNNTY